MDAKELFRRAIGVATEVINQVDTMDFTAPTPDTEWNVRDLTGHMLYELSWAADILRGATIAEVGDKYDGDLLGDDLSVQWRQAAEAALQALETADLAATAHLSYGDVPAEQYIREQATDQLIHAWDLGAAIGWPVHYEDDVAAALYDHAVANQESLAASSLFAGPLDVPADADMQTKVLALYGRAADWRQPGLDPTA